MKSFTQTRRWAHWSFGLGASILCIGFGFGFYKSYRNPQQLGEGVRVIIPPFILCIYWVLATALNFRTVRVNSGGMSVFVWPFPVRRNLHFDRNHIEHTYARYVSNKDVDGVEFENFYMAGVESRSGFQIDLAGPYEASEHALADARRIAEFLNQGEYRRRIHAATVQARHQAPGHVRRTLIWGGAFIVAILIGAYWEISRLPNLRFVGFGH